MLFRLLTAAVVASTALLAQIGTSTITGRVTDPTGAVIPAVKLLVIAKDTNFQYTASTNQEGLFRVQSLQPGPYQVIFEASGFKRVVRDNIDLRTGDVLPVNATLELGDTSESIEVTASAPLLETETSATGTVAEGQFLYSLPMFQRFTNSTLHLVPGMTAGGYTWGETLGGFHIAGQRGTVGFFNDGVNGQDQGSGTNTVKVVQNSIAEIKVLTTALPAEYGHSAGGVVSVVTKTGTNDLHGLASLYGRTRRMQHRRFFDMYRNSQPRPGAPHGQQSFTIHPDFNLGGPVFLPKIYDGRNKTFFFISYQKYIEKMKSEQYYGTVPNDDMKNGIFTFGGVGQALYDPATTRQLPDGTWTRDPIPGNIIPKSRFDPVAVKVLELDPWQSPNLSGSFGSNGPVNNFMWAEYARSFKPDFSIRLDHQFTPAVKLNGGLTYNANAGLGRPGTIRLNEFDGSQGGKNPWRSFSYTAGSTWIVSPTIINDFRAGYYRRRNWREIPSWGTDWGQTLGIPNIPVNMMPSLSTGYGFSIDGPNQTIGETISFRDDLTVVQGTHAFKLGYELMNLRRNQWNVYRPAGTFSFDSAWGLQPTGNPMPRTGNTFAGFLLGYVQQAEFTQALASYLPRSSIHSFYFQDDWKATPTLTLNLGVRYTNESPFNTKWGQMSNFDPAAVDELTGRPGGIIHPGKPLNVREQQLPAACRRGMAPVRKVGFPRRLRREYYRCEVPRRPVRRLSRAGEPAAKARRPAPAIPHQPRAGPDCLPHPAEWHFPLRGHELRFAQHDTLRPRAAQPLRPELESQHTVRVHFELPG